MFRSRQNHPDLSFSPKKQVHLGFSLSQQIKTKKINKSYLGNYFPNMVHIACRWIQNQLFSLYSSLDRSIEDRLGSLGEIGQVSLTTEKIVHNVDHSLCTSGQDLNPNLL